MKAHMIHVCRFSTLDEIPKSYRGERYVEAVVRLLTQHKRFSCFEVDAKLARCLDTLLARGTIKYIHDESRYAYPWVGVEVRRAPVSEVIL
jgi:hypothetical protein